MILKGMPDYKNGKIYKIVCNETELIYIGSTCEPTLARRLSKHVDNFKQWKKGKAGYMTSFKKIENGNYDIVLIELCPCESKDQLHARERYYIETVACVNKVIAGRKQKEYRESNKEKINEYQKDYRKVYYDKNKYSFKEKYENRKDKIRMPYHCECGVVIQIRHKSEHNKTKKHLENIKKLESSVDV